MHRSRKLSEEATDYSNNRHAAATALLKRRLAVHVIDSLIEGLAVLDSSGSIEYVNPSFMSITGYYENDAVGKTMQMLGKAEDEVNFAEVLSIVRHSGSWEGEVPLKRKDGTAFTADIKIGKIHCEEGGRRFYAVTINDVTERKLYERQIRHQAYHDPLTGLPNRLLLSDRLSEALKRAERHNTKMAIMFIDLDQFKVVNDLLGHHIGDELLKQFAVRLKGSVRKSDTVARLGGDEFVVVLPDIARDQDAAVVAKKIFNAAGGSISVEGHQITISPSIGISLYPTDGTKAEILLKRADAAMYQAKNQGKNNYYFFAEKG